MIKVLIVDDSVLMRTVIRDILGTDSSIEVVGTATDGKDALGKIEALKPDVVSLDIEMPRMNGLELLKALGTVSRRPRILMFSSLTARGAEMTNEAIRLGADDFMLKPRDLPHMRETGPELVSKIRHLAILSLTPHARKDTDAPVRPAERLVLIGSSAGGPPQVDTLLSMLPPALPAGMIITQHMPPGFTAPLAERFNRISPMPVRETRNGGTILEGEILLSKAGVHTIISGELGQDGKTTGRIIHTSSPPLHGVRPAVDRTFESAARIFKKNTLAVILSGMGNDAGAGAYAVKQAGGASIICDEKDCLVYGMARSAIRLNAVDEVIPLKKLAGSIEQHVARMVESSV